MLTYHNALHGEGGEEGVALLGRTTLSLSNLKVKRLGSRYEKVLENLSVCVSGRVTSDEAGFIDPYID